MHHGPPPDAEAAGALIAGLLCVIMFAILIGLAIQIFIIYLLYSAMDRLPQNARQLSAGLIWLLLIPLFNAIWLFFVVIRLSDSYHDYLVQRGDPHVDDCGKLMGILWAVFSLVIPIVGLVFMILYLVKMSELKGRVSTTPTTTVDYASPQAPQ
jgi:hypothetical protein